MRNMKSIEGTDMSPSNFILRVSAAIIGLVLCVSLLTWVILRQVEHQDEKEKEVVVVVLDTSECFVGRSYRTTSDYFLLKEVWDEIDLRVSLSTPHSLLATQRPWQWAAVNLGADPIECQGDIAEEEEE